MSGGIFISYRRDDADHAAGRLVLSLEKTFSHDQLFMDIDNIDPGVNFVKALSEKVEACDVLLAIIGPNWLDANDENGKRRLDDPHDFVRIEIEAALRRDIRVVPVLVDGAQMPRKEHLPKSLRELVSRQAVRLGHERFGADADGLATALAKVVRGTSVRTPTRTRAEAGIEADAPKAVSGDFLPRPFSAEFYDKLRRFGARTKAVADNLSIEKLVVIHYIRDHFQVGLRAYQGLDPIKSEADGRLPLLVATDWGGPDRTVDFFGWNDDMSLPTIDSRTRDEMSTTPSCTISGREGPRNLSIFKFYDDPGRPDFFRVNPFSVGLDIPLHHFVVVRNEDLQHWNPNKFVFEVRADKTINFSLAVYTALAPGSPALTEAHTLLSKFCAISETNLDKQVSMEHLRERFMNVKQRVREIFREDSFVSDVTVFWLTRKGNVTNLFLAYVFPRS